MVQGKKQLNSKPKFANVVDSAEELAAKIGGNVKVIAEEPYYRYIPKNGLKLSTKVSMAVSDQFKMVKMIHLKL